MGRGPAVHELSIAWEIARIADESAARVGAGRVVRVEVAVGELSGVQPEALAFAWEAACAGWPRCRGALLELRPVGLRVYCRSCRAEGAPRPHSVACARCGSLETRVVCGEELDVVRLEVERDDAAGGAGTQPGAVAQR